MSENNVIVETYSKNDGDFNQLLDQSKYCGSYFLRAILYQNDSVNPVTVTITVETRDGLVFTLATAAGVSSFVFPNANFVPPLALDRCSRIRFATSGAQNGDSHRVLMSFSEVWGG